MSEWTSETADWYASKYGEYPTNRLTIAQLDLAADARVLDIGCGTGAALRAASSKVRAGALIGVDPVPRMIEIAHERLVGHAAAERIQLHVAPAHELPVGDGSIDVVLALDSYDHWGDHAADGLAEVARVLAHGGRFVVVKDAGVPFAPEAKQAFVDALSGHGFEVLSERTLHEADVSFTLWICASPEARV